MILGFSVGIALLIALADVFVNIKEKKPGKVIHTLFRDTILVFLFHFGVMKYIFKIENVYSSAHEGAYVFNTISFCFLTGAVYFLLNTLCQKYSLGEDDPVKMKHGNRAVKVLSEVDFIAAEDTRNSGLFLSRLGIRRPLVSYYEHNKASRGPEIADRLEAGESCALISDAGTPAISDTGEDLVRL